MRLGPLHIVWGLRRPGHWSQVAVFLLWCAWALTFLSIKVAVPYIVGLGWLTFTKMGVSRRAE